MVYDQYCDSPFTKNGAAKEVVFGIERMTEIRILLDGQNQAGLNLHDLDEFIEDAAKLLGTIIGDNKAFYAADAKALYHDIEVMVEIRGKLQNTAFPHVAMVDGVIMMLFDFLKKLPGTFDELRNALLKGSW